MTDFDVRAEDYSKIMDSTVGWIGQDHDFFNAAKARLLAGLARSHLGNPRDVKVLDIGCGVGLIDRFLVGSMPKLHGIDVSAQWIAIAQKICPQATFRDFDGTRIPYADCAFDMAIAT